MQDQILQVDENMLETRLDRLVSEKVEQLLNAEADEITGAARYERTGDRKAYRVGHYERDLTVKAGRDPQGPEAQGRAVRVGGDRTIQAS